jgi:hypothetical protein
MERAWMQKKPYTPPKIVEYDPKVAEWVQQLLRDTFATPAQQVLPLSSQSDEHSIEE